MSDSGSRLRVSRAQAASLVNSQISTGDDLRRAIARATALTDLQALRPQLSAWSTRNEHVLVKVFGESERQTYRLARPPVVALRGLEVQRAQMERRADSRLRYLQGAVTRIDLAEEMADSPVNVSGFDRQTGHDSERSAARAAAGQEEAPRKPWWRAVLANSWTIAVAAPLIAAALLAIGAYAVSHIDHGSSIVTGSIVCESGRPVAGVWIAASAGQSDSGYAHLGTSDSSGTSYPIGSTGTYSYLLPHGGTYAVHVGCGGTAAHWASRNYSPLLSSRIAHLRCDDPTTASAGGVIPRGECTVVAAS